MRRASLILAVLTTGVASFAFLGAVSVSAMWGYVFIASLVGTTSALVFGQPGQFMALVAASVPPIVWAVVVNALSGDMMGPAARSSAICGLASVVAVHGARGGRTDQFFGSIVLLVSGAMLYGSAGEVLPIIVSVAICAVVTIFLITYARHRLTTSMWGAGALLFTLATFIVLVSGVLILANVLPRLITGREPVISTALREQTVDFSPSWKHSASQGPLTNTANNTPDTDLVIPQGTENLNQTMFVVAFVLLLLVIMAGLARIVWVRRRLTRWQQQLRALPTRQAIAGSWAWAEVNMRRWRWSFPPHVGVESATWGELQQWPSQLRDDFKSVSHLATAALFAPGEPELQTLEESWAISSNLVTNSRRATPRWRRFVALFELVDQ